MLAICLADARESSTEGFDLRFQKFLTSKSVNPYVDCICFIRYATPSSVGEDGGDGTKATAFAFIEVNCCACMKGGALRRIKVSRSLSV